MRKERGDNGDRDHTTFVITYESILQKTHKRTGHVVEYIHPSQVKSKRPHETREPAERVIHLRCLLVGGTARPPRDHKTQRIEFQTGGAGSAARRDNPRRNTGRNERVGVSTVGSSGVDSRAGVGTTSPDAGVAWVAVTRGWSMVDVETRLPSLPPSIVGGVVVIRSKEV